MNFESQTSSNQSQIGQAVHSHHILYLSSRTNIIGRIFRKLSFCFHKGLSI